MIHLATVLDDSSGYRRPTPSDLKRDIHVVVPGAPMEPISILKVQAIPFKPILYTLNANPQISKIAP